MFSASTRVRPPWVGEGAVKLVVCSSYLRTYPTYSTCERILPTCKHARAAADGVGVPPLPREPNHERHAQRVLEDRLLQRDVKEPLKSR